MGTPTCPAFRLSTGKHSWGKQETRSCYFTRNDMENIQEYSPWTEEGIQLKKEGIDGKEDGHDFL